MENCENLIVAGTEINPNNTGEIGDSTNKTFFNKKIILLSIIEFCVSVLFLLKILNVIDIDFVLMNFPTPILIVSLCAIAKYFIIEQDRKIKKLFYVITLLSVISIVCNYVSSNIINNLSKAILGSISLFIFVFFSIKFDKKFSRYYLK